MCRVVRNVCFCLRCIAWKSAFTPTNADHLRRFKKNHRLNVMSMFPCFPKTSVNVRKPFCQERESENVCCLPPPWSRIEPEGLKLLMECVSIVVRLSTGNCYNLPLVLSRQWRMTDVQQIVWDNREFFSRKVITPVCGDTAEWLCLYLCADNLSVVSQKYQLYHNYCVKCVVFQLYNLSVNWAAVLCL